MFFLFLLRLSFNNLVNFYNYFLESKFDNKITALLKKVTEPTQIYKNVIKNPNVLPSFTIVIDSKNMSINTIINNSTNNNNSNAICIILITFKTREWFTIFPFLIKRRIVKLMTKFIIKQISIILLPPKFQLSNCGGFGILRFAIETATGSSSHLAHCHWQ